MKYVQNKTAGYSRTPLAKKLGLKATYHALIIGAPDSVIAMAKEEGLASLSVIASPTAAGQLRQELDYIHLFSNSAAELMDAVYTVKPGLKTDGLMWLSWPKKASKVKTDIDETVIRKCGLDAGLVDIKVCAIDEIWSGLKFVYRLKDRNIGRRTQRRSSQP